jgi:nucleotide-binding universal stress UspA family protein
MTLTRRAWPVQLKTLLVPLDGSPLAEQAVPVAAMLAKGTGGRVHLVTVAPALAGPAYLPRIAEALSGDGIRTSTALLEGAVAPTLAAYVEKHEVDLVVMTTHGRGGVSRLWLGSVADQLLRRSTAPVLLLRADVAIPPTGFQCIIVGLDGSPESEAALRPALALAGTTPRSRIVLVQVVAPLIPELDTRPATAALDHLAHRVRLRGIQATARVMTGNNTAERIHQLAHSTEADLIVVGICATGGIERLALGSVADKVVRGADRAVVVVPRTARRRRAAADGPHTSAWSTVP